MYLTTLYELRLHTLPSLAFHYVYSTEYHTTTQPTLIFYCILLAISRHLPTRLFPSLFHSLSLTHHTQPHITCPHCPNSSPQTITLNLISPHTLSHIIRNQTQPDHSSPLTHPQVKMLQTTRFSSPISTLSCNTNTTQLFLPILIT